MKCLNEDGRLVQIAFLHGAKAEVNFKLDKLSTRVTKIQSDNQMRLTDLENADIETKQKKVKKNLPGTSKPADFGANPGYSVSNLPEEQQTSSIEISKTVFKEKGTVTPGNSSGLNDGAAALLLTTSEEAQNKGQTTLSR